MYQISFFFNFRLFDYSTKMTSLQFLWLTLVGFLCTTQINSYKILGLFPHPGVSHFHFFHPLLRALAETGHEVTVVSHFPDKEPVNENYIDLPLTGLEFLQNSVDLDVSICILCSNLNVIEYSINFNVLIDTQLNTSFVNAVMWEMIIYVSIEE